ncbi:MAG: ThiF family adenylyltransferase [Planctomycetes bacterium]|nr:ThiF family adenylyltransferase [Planctomycetota bacterium]MCB9909234.1 ThiF family adenylyltransferase [Planctomycetota bacterium]HPF15786.1 ThiF family adenylyltransferase [Planctomycetota bacterium]
MTTTPDNRFDRQTRFAPFGTAGQAKLEQASVFLLGAGALGGVIAQSLVRSGVGRLVFADRDSVDWTNLPRQVLFEDRHAAASTPKAWAALEALERIGGPTRLEAHATHVDADNLVELSAGCDVLLDGSDNLETRYLLNDLAVKSDRPWVYAGVIGGGGLVMPIRPNVGPCLRCLFPEPPPPGTLETCDTSGVLMPAVGSVASLAAGMALRLLVDPAGTPLRLMEIDAWHGELRTLSIPRHPECPACGKRTFPFLEAPLSERTLTLCGRNTVQVRGQGVEVDLDAMARRLAQAASRVERLGPLLRAELDGHRVTLFRDGRALIEGTEDRGTALAIYDRFLA